jgi:hypothetical protein
MIQKNKEHNLGIESFRQKKSGQDLLNPESQECQKNENKSRRRDKSTTMMLLLDHGEELQFYPKCLGSLERY